MPTRAKQKLFDTITSLEIAKQKSAYIVQTARSVTVTNVLAPFFALGLFYDDADPIKLSIWLSYMAFATFIRTWTTSQLEYREEKIETPDRDLKVVTLGVALIGAGWGLGWFLLVPDLNEMNRMIYLFVTAGGMFNSMFGYCVHWPTFYSFVIPTMVPAVTSVLWNRDLFPWPFAVGISILLVSVFKIGKNFSKTFEDSVRLRLRNEKLYEELALERDQSIAANVAKSNFVASASHDLRQPMYAVNMYLDTLDLNIIPASQIETITKIKGSVETLNEMFEALLNISKLDSLSFKPSNHSFSVDQFSKALHQVVRPLALQKKLRIEFDAIPNYAFGDDALLNQMLLNLISNAIHYTDAGHVDVKFFIVHDCLHISVADTGCGITEEDQTRIFQEFFRVDKTRSAHDGLGLGLSIVKRLSALIGAEVSIESYIGKGTKFTVTTQYPVSDSIQKTEKLYSVAQSKQQSVVGKTVAVIEDDPVVLEGYAKALSTRGAVVIKIELTEQAFEDQMIMFATTQIDFIISDYRLGNLTGAEIIGKLREVFDREIPAMIVTADTSPAHIQFFLKLNIPVLHKPISFQRVVAVLESKLGQRAAITSE